MIDRKNGNLLNPDVIAASRMLNAAINQYNKIVEEKLKKY
ncbi:Spo0E family sporulation regulatory protein-aspartic acid phosphatase [Clostridium sp.]